LHQLTSEGDTVANRIVAINMTNFFNRELFMYSLGDIRFKKPISLKRVAWTTVFLLVWTLPIVLIFGIQLNVFFAVITLGPPLFLGPFVAKPRFGGKGLVDYIKSTVKHIGEPKGWTDLHPTNELDRGVYFTEDEVWISRRRELQLLADMKEKRKKARRA
jgi:hypothetical protein